jgi:hypothetical protein
MPTTPSVSLVPALTTQDGFAALYFARKFKLVPVVESLQGSNVSAPVPVMSKDVAA